MFLSTELFSDIHVLCTCVNPCACHSCGLAYVTAGPTQHFSSLFTEEILSDDQIIAILNFLNNTEAMK